MVTLTLPRFVYAKILAKGGVAFFWKVPNYWRTQGCPFTSSPLGAGLNQAQLDEAAAGLNGQFDDWLAESRGATPGGRAARVGTIRWLVDTYLDSDPFKESVAEPNRADYRNVLNFLLKLPTTKPDLYPDVGALPVKSVSPAAADKLYKMAIKDDKFRRGEKVVTYCKTAWKDMLRLHPDQFITDPRIANPWIGVTLRKRVKKVKPAADRDSVYAFAWAAIEAKRPELGAAAVICFEWLQRPMNVVAGHIGWSDYRSPAAPTKIRIVHHKTGKTVLHPLEERDADGAVVKFYEEAEEVLSRLPRRGTIMILGPEGQRYKSTRFAQLVRRIAERAGLPETFSLDACRHGGMTELEEAELTEGQGMALSAHSTPSAYRGYAKRTERRLMAATRRRMAYRDLVDAEAAATKAENAA